MFKKLAGGYYGRLFIKRLFLYKKCSQYQRFIPDRQSLVLVSRLSHYVTIISSFWPIVLATKMEWVPKIEYKDSDGEQPAVTSVQKLKILEHVKNLMEAGRLEEAESVLDRALDIARRAHNMDWTNILLLILAKLTYNKKDYKKAERHYLELNNNFNMPQEQTTVMKKLKVHTAYDLAKIYEVTNDYEKAEKLYKHCLAQIQVMNVGSEDYSWATNVLERVLDSYSLFLTDRNRYQEALTYRNTVYSLVKVVHGEESEKACYCLNELGRLHAFMGDDEAAMDYLAKALRIGRKLPINTSGLIAIYVNNGLLLMKKKIFSKAKEYCTEAKKEARNSKDAEGTAQADACLRLIEQELNA